MDTDLTAQRRRHLDAVAAFARHARALTAAESETPRAPGKWTPAEETAHLTLGYRAFTSAIVDGSELALRVPAERALELKAKYLPRILRGGWFPSGAESPDEAAPRAPVTRLPRGVDDLEAAARSFDETVGAAFANDPSVSVRHPYFGALLLPELVALLTAHAEHHRAYLPVGEGDRAP